MRKIWKGVESVHAQYSRKSVRDRLQNNFAVSISCSQISEKMQLNKQQPSMCLGDGELQQVRVILVSYRLKAVRHHCAVPILALYHPGQSSTMHRSIPLCCTALSSCCCLRALTATEQLLREQSQSLCSLWQTKNNSHDLMHPLGHLNLKVPVCSKLPK